MGKSEQSTQLEGSLLEKELCASIGFLISEWGLAEKERKLGVIEEPPKEEGNWTGKNGNGDADCTAI